MAKIIEDKVVIVLSRIVKSSDEDEHDRVLDGDQLATLQEAVEGLVNDESVVVEVVTE